MFGILVQSLAIIVIILLLCNGVCLAQNLTAHFILGDSLVDAGNNNYIATFSKANYFPNGIDFGLMPTGRYTNGRTIVDIIGQQMGLNGFVPPYLAPTTNGPMLLQGVNYASGAGGILNETGKCFGGRINMDAQLDNFANTRQDIISLIGLKEAMKLLESALFSVAIGSNDFINNYFTLPVSTLQQKLVPPEVFVAAMIEKFRAQLTRLYTLGARKIIVANVGPIGCIPNQKDINPPSSSGDKCVALPNSLAQLFNNHLRGLVTELNANLMGSNFVYADVFRIVTDIINNYLPYGFENADSACCHVAGKYGGLVPCGPQSKVCPDRSKFVFWDPYHPSEATNNIIANRLIHGGSTDVWPLNIRQLFSTT